MSSSKKEEMDFRQRSKNPFAGIGQRGEGSAGGAGGSGAGLGGGGQGGSQGTQHRAAYGVGEGTAQRTTHQPLCFEGERDSPDTGDALAVAAFEDIMRLKEGAELGDLMSDIKGLVKERKLAGRDAILLDGNLKL